MKYDEFTEVSNCAAASDGGSLWIELAGTNSLASFVLIRSLASRGTPEYGSVVSEAGQTLSQNDVAALCARLATLLTNHSSCDGLAREFVQGAQRNVPTDDASIR